METPPQKGGQEISARRKNGAPPRRGVPRYVAILAGLIAVFAILYWLNDAPGRAIRRTGAPEIVASNAVVIPFHLATAFKGGTVHLDIAAPDGRILSIPVDVLPAESGNGLVAWADLEESPYAGAVLDARLTVTAPGLGRRETSAFRLALPKRRFNHPAAAAIERVRHKLESGKPDRASAAAQLALLRDTPQDFGQDLTVYTTLSAAIARLEIADSGADIEENAELSGLLFRTARRIEDGPLSDALAVFRERTEKAASRIVMNEPGAAGGLVRAVADIAALRDDAQSDPGTAAASAHLLARIEARTLHGDATGALRALNALRGRIEREWIAGLGNRTRKPDRAEALAGMLAAARDIKAGEAVVLRTLKYRMEALGAAGPVPLALSDLSLHQATLAARLGNLSKRLAGLGVEPPSALDAAIRETSAAERAFAEADLEKAQESALNSYAALELTTEMLEANQIAAAPAP